MTEALLFLVRAVADLFVMFVLLRLLMQTFRADFRNPLAQAVLQITSPLIIPARRLLPPIGKFDTATIAVALIVEFAFLLFVNWVFFGGAFGVLQLALFSVLRCLSLTIWLMVFVLFVYVILSWVSSGYNPATAIVHSLAEPLLRPVRRIIPLVGGIDFSPMVLILLLMALNMVISSELPGILG
ncbi:MAG: YggT family protein [Pseudomonadota bacterium]